MNPNGFQQSANNKYASPLTNTSEIDIGTDIAKTGNIFMSDPKKHEDLKLMLESNKDSLKLEAMKRIISMVAKGRECGELFPSVVKNVVSKNAEVKKLVFAYLTRYAEEQQDLALLSISTFQRALRDPNQLIRGSALRVLSSIRVPMIAPIMMLAIKESVMDMSPYVRKIAAHAIPKLFSLDSAMKDQLLEVIEKLLGDKTTLVAGSAIQAFEEVCPDRFDLIHKHYRKLCALLIDVEEWGQVVIINMLTRYARTQFLDPNSSEEPSHQDRQFYSDEDSADSSEEEGPKKKGAQKATSKTMDSDHRLLITSARSLLHSRNPAVVMSVVQLFYHCAPRAEMSVVIRALVRLLKCDKEVQFVVLSNIATMSIGQSALFQGYLKSFYVYNSDSTQIKLLKLEILTNLATESNISVILRELQNYIGNTDQDFVTATIQAIGRCASNIAEVSDNCLTGLIQLISRKDENIVAEAVVVIRKLLQMQTSDHKDIIVNMAVLLDTINVPMAKASIIWLIGEYCDRVPKIAPDVLRKAAKTFVDEKDIVKLQTINLAAKLYITNPKQTRLLAQYVLNLAKYDLSYDIRDRARFTKALLFPQAQENKDDPSNSNGSLTFLSKRVKKIFLATKPAPLLQSKYKDRHNFQLGTMSHILNHRVVGYKDLPDWPSVAPDASVRAVPEVQEYTSGSAGGLLATETLSSKKENQEFYPDDENSESSSGSSSGSSDSEASDKVNDQRMSDNKVDVRQQEDEDSSNDSAQTNSVDDDDDSDDNDQPSKNATPKTKTPEPSKPVITHSKVSKSAAIVNDADKDSKASSSDSTEDSSNSSSSSEEDSDRSPVRTEISNSNISKKKDVPKAKPKPPSNKAPEVDLLLDFDEPLPGGSPAPANQTPVMSAVPLIPSIMDKILNDSPISSSTEMAVNDDIYVPTDIPVKSIEILSKFANSYMVVECQFTRSLSAVLSNPKFVSVTLLVTNISTDVLHDVNVVKSADVDTFSKIDSLLPGKTVTVTLGIDFKDSTQPVSLVIGFYIILAGNAPESGEESLKGREQPKRVDLKVKAPIGELLQPINMTEKEFVSHQSKLKGMSEFSASVPLPEGVGDGEGNGPVRRVTRAVYRAANVVTVAARKQGDGRALLRFAGSSCSQRRQCLIEAVVEPGLCTLRVNCDQITLGSQLPREIGDALKAAT